MTKPQQPDVAYICIRRSTGDPHIEWQFPGDRIQFTNCRPDTGEVLDCRHATPTDVIAVAKADARTALDAVASSADYTAYKLAAAGHTQEARQLNELSEAIVKVMKDKLWKP
jgi:hypothetical protein